MTERISDDPPDAVVLRPDFGRLASVQISGASDGAPRCRHRATIVDEEARSIECATCSAPLDPIGVLLEYARKERHWRHWDAELSATQTRLEAAKRQERLVKARTRAADRKDAAAAVAAERARTERERLEIAELGRDVAALGRRIERAARALPKGEP